MSLPLPSTVKFASKEKLTRYLASNFVVQFFPENHFGDQIDFVKFNNIAVKMCTCGDFNSIFLIGIKYKY